MLGQLAYTHTRGEDARRRGPWFDEQAPRMWADYPRRSEGAERVIAVTRGGLEDWTRGRGLKGEERRKEAENGESDERGAVARQNAGAFDACGDDLSKVDRVAEHARSSLESLPQRASGA